MGTGAAVRPGEQDGIDRRKAELVHRQGPWRGLEDLELATLEWVDWFNHRRLSSTIGYVPPAEYEASQYCESVPAPAGTQ